jgi:hypothetical protein
MSESLPSTFCCIRISDRESSKGHWAPCSQGIVVEMLRCSELAVKAQAFLANSAVTEPSPPYNNSV